MKKAFVIGMVVVSATLSMSAAHAAGAKSVSESLMDYTRQVKEATFGQGGSAKDLSGQKAKVARDKLVNELGLPSGKASALSIAISSDSGRLSQRLENLATVIAAKKMAVEISKTNPTEGGSIDAAASASAKLLANSSLTGANVSVKGSRGGVKLLSENEMSDTTAALTKLEELPEVILTKFSKAERDSYTEIINKHDELIELGTKRSSEEALVQAIMDVKKVDKLKAMELVKKLKECV